MTLGILSEFEEDNPDTLNEGQIQAVFDCAIKNINGQYPQICKHAVQTLQRIVPSTTKNFMDDNQRNYIMGGIFAGLLIEDEEIQDFALQALAEVPTVGYNYVGQYLQRIGEFTVSLISNPTRLKSIKHALLFWNNLCKEELKMQEFSHDIISKCFPSLIQILLQGMLITEWNNDEI